MRTILGMLAHRKLNALLKARFLAAAIALPITALTPGTFPQAAAQTAISPEDKAKDAAGGLAEVAPPQSAPRPQQIEPIVGPVKRVAPKTPVLETSTKPAAGGKFSGKSDKKTAVVVPSRPNCDSGFKVDDSGKSCVRASVSASKSKVQKTSGKKH